METPGNIEVDPYVDNIVPVAEGEEQYQEAVDEPVSYTHLTLPTNREV